VIGGGGDTPASAASAIAGDSAADRFENARGQISRFSSNLKVPMWLSLEEKIGE
jgi:hypothetical protein